MKLFYSKGACSLAIRIILNEIGIPADYEQVSLQTKLREDGSDFLQVNPKGSVPTLLLENGEVLTENAVIMQYLADHYQASNLLPELGDFQRYRVLEWVNYVTTELHKGFGPLFNPKVPQELKDQVFVPGMIAKLTYVDKCLQENPYLLGKHFTLPDAYLFVILRWVKGMKLEVASLEHLAQYEAQLRTRKSIVDALHQEGLKF